MGALDGLRVLIKDISAKIYSWPVIICGVDSNGNPVPFGASPASGGGGGGIPVTPPTVNGVKVVGIQEARNYGTPQTAATATIAAGALSVLIEFSSDFVGTIGGIARTGAAQVAYSDVAQPGNTLPAYAITRSAGTYTITTGTPA